VIVALVAVVIVELTAPPRPTRSRRRMAAAADGTRRGRRGGALRGHATRLTGGARRRRGGVVGDSSSEPRVRPILHVRPTERAPSRIGSRRMRRTTIALLAALEASVASVIGLGLVVVPLSCFGRCTSASPSTPPSPPGRRRRWLLGPRRRPRGAARPGGRRDGSQCPVRATLPITIALLASPSSRWRFGRRIGRRSAAGGHSFSGGLAAVAVFSARGRRARDRRGRGCRARRPVAGLH
jgi:hypothetical protein